MVNQFVQTDSQIKTLILPKSGNTGRTTYIFPEQLRQCPNGDPIAFKSHCWAIIIRVQAIPYVQNELKSKRGSVLIKESELIEDTKYGLNGFIFRTANHKRFDRQNGVFGDRDGLSGQI